MKSPVAIIPLGMLAAGSLPMFWLLWRRKKRFKTFSSQLPDALEMLARALRAGQSLGFGFNAVAVGNEPTDRQGIRPRF